MTQDQWLRGIPYVVIGVSTALFSLSSFVRAWRKGEHPYAPGWPIPWSALTGSFFLAIATLAFVNVTRIFAEWSVKTEHRLAYVVLWFAALINVWTLVRWWREDGDV